MANFNEHALEMSIMELFKDEEYTYVSGDQIHRERTEVLLTDDLKQYLYTDWSARDDIKANLQVDLILLLDEFGYPPVTIDDVYKEVLEQAENFKKYAN